MTHVLVATDGSEQSLKAARYLRSLLDPASLEKVSIIAVVRPLAAVPFASDFGEEAHAAHQAEVDPAGYSFCLLYTSPSPRDRTRSRMPSSA